MHLAVASMIYHYRCFPGTNKSSGYLINATYLGIKNIRSAQATCLIFTECAKCIDRKLSNQTITTPEADLKEILG